MFDGRIATIGGPEGKKQLRIWYVEAATLKHERSEPVSIEKQLNKETLIHLFSFFNRRELYQLRSVSRTFLRTANNALLQENAPMIDAIQQIGHHDVNDGEEKTSRFEM